MNKILLAALSLLLFTSCDERVPVIHGKLEVNRKITLTDMGGKLQDYEPGEFVTRLRFPEKTKFKLSIDQEGRPSLGFFFRVPKGTKLPQNGQVVIESKHLKQNYKAVGNFTTVINDGPERREFESCSYTEWEQVCTRLPRGGMSCHTVPRTRWGRRDVEYFMRDVERDFEISLYEDAYDQPAAIYTGEHNYRVRIDRYVGQCW